MSATEFDSDIAERVSRIEGEIIGTRESAAATMKVADALFKLSDRMHADMIAMKDDVRDMRQEFKADMGDMRTELKADIRSGHWERLGIVLSVLVAGATIAASIYFKT